jgi:hypothetical protein
MVSPPFHQLIASAFPGVVFRPVDIDPELPGEVIEAFMIPDALVASFSDFVQALSIERVRAGGAPVVVVAHSVSWTKAHAPKMCGPDVAPVR